MTLPLRIIRPSSKELQDLLPGRIAELTAAGFAVRFDDLPPDPDWAYTAAPKAERARALEAALLEPDTVAVLAARGGYGASDLLPLLDWQRLAVAPEKVVVGFSDVSALHSALYARLGWRGLHAPMPATALWRKAGDADVEALLAFLQRLPQGDGLTGAIDVALVTPAGQAVPAPLEGPLTGPLFGGCFTVLTNLLATPFFPENLASHIVFIEDTDENPARLMRALNQWLQSGALDSAQALVIGHLRGLGDKIPDSAPFVLAEVARRVAPLPVFHTPLFGHTSPNFPLPVGAKGTIANGRLTWTWPWLTKGA